ncbi:MAG: AAA family ATPase [Caldilineales bacterium]|nr:AAA family ATPase [Caldilineales bacterium]
MICPNCQHLNREGARFCDNCGHKLDVVCPNCGTPNHPDARFCNHCGYRLAEGAAPVAQAVPAPALSSAPTPPDIPSERRVVTMLFCDVVGSTAAAERLDPEEWTEIVNGAFERMTGPVEQYEGTVARLMGDAILAFFGAPVAHEDDPVRAILAGLEIIRGIEGYRGLIESRWGVEFAVRVGINTGLVVVGDVGSSQGKEYTAIGDAVNIAARMEQLARPGTVQIAHDTYQLVAPLFDFEELGPIDVKGKAEPVRAYRLLGRKALPGSLRGIQGLRAPMVGRQQELAALTQQIQRLEAGVGGIVSLIGEAGLGKSRLLAEAQAGFAPPQRWIEVSSLSYETHLPYGLIRSLLFAILQTMHGDAVDVHAARLAELTAGMPQEQQAQVRATLAVLFGGESELSGESLKAELFVAMSDFVRYWVGQRSIVLVCDDLHWADDASVELLGRLIGLSDSAPILFIFAFRPDRTAASWRFRTQIEEQSPHRLTTVWLRPLASGESDMLINELLRVAALPDSLRASILDRSAGNPFFLEEAVRALIDQGVVVWDAESGRWRAAKQVEAFEIPDNVQSLLISRIDRLQEQARRTVQLASVIGRSFYLRVLKHIADAVAELDQQLLLLQREELIVEAARLPELEYMFRHSLLQEAAYSTILLKQRRAYHDQVARVLVDLFPDQREELAPLIAHHFLESDQPRMALEFLALAADTAYRLHALPAALEHFSRGLDIALQSNQPDDPVLAHLFEGKGRVLELSSQFRDALAHYETMEAYARQHGQTALLVAALNAQGTLRSTANELFDPELGAMLANQVLELAQQQGEHQAEALALWNLMNIERFGFRSLGLAADYGERALALARQFGPENKLPFIANDLSDVYASWGELTKGKEMSLEAMALFRARHNLPMLADSLTTAATIHFFCGELDQAEDFIDEAQEISLRIGNLWGQAYSRGWSGLVNHFHGEPDAAIAAFSEGIELAEQAHFLIGQIFPRQFLAMIYLELGAVAEGKPIAIRAMTLAEENFPQMAVSARGVTALFYLREGDLSRAQALLEGVIVEEMATNLFVGPFALPALTAGARQLGQMEKALALNQIFIHIAEDMGAQIFAPEAFLEHSEILYELGDVDEAIAALEKSLAYAIKVGDRWVELRSSARLAAVYNESGDSAKALPYRHQAETVAESILSRISDPELRAGFRGELQRLSLGGDGASQNDNG